MKFTPNDGFTRLNADIIAEASLQMVTRRKWEKKTSRMHPVLKMFHIHREPPSAEHRQSPFLSVTYARLGVTSCPTLPVLD